MKPREVVNAIYGLGKFYFKEEKGQVVGVLSAHVRKHQSEYSLDQLAQVISSLARVGLPNAPLLTSMIASITRTTIQTCSSQSLVNLMVAFSRFGVRPNRKVIVWEILAEELNQRLSQLSLDDAVAGLLAYSISHLGAPHVELFRSVSRLLNEETSPKCITKYLRGCARAQYRDIEALTVCASVLRREEDSIDEEVLKEIISNFDHLGIDFFVKSQIPNSLSAAPWFAKRVLPSKTVKPVRSLRRRKWTW